MPNDQWDDRALDERLRAIDRRMESAENTLTAVSQLPMQVAIMTRTLEGYEEWLRDAETRLREEIKGVRTLCNDIRADAKQSQIDRNKNRTTIAIAIIAGAFTVLAALITAIATVITTT